MKDFFVSYNNKDQAWAEWAAWQLEEAGFSTIVQAWDFRPGNNFVLAMQDAAEQAERTIAVLSPNYLGSDFVRPEWAAAFAGDPTGIRTRLLPVRVAECELPGMLAQINYVDLVALDERAARDTLLAALQPGRAKPATPPPFPATSGAGRRPSAFPADAPTGRELDWQVMAQPPTFVWRDAVFPQRYGGSGRAALEVHLIPIPEQRVEVRRLGTISDELVTAGRRGGLFATAQGVEQTSGDRLAAAYVQDTRVGASTGLLVGRGGQRGGWFPLPYDDMGSVYEQADALPRLSAVLELLMTLDLPLPSRFALAARIEPVTLLQRGAAASVGGRTTAQLPFAMRSVESVEPEDTVSASALMANVTAVAEEIVARVEAKLDSVGR